MNEYHKIQTVYLRDPAMNYKTVLIGQYALPEFEYLADAQWVFTEKVDGMNIRVMFDGEGVTFGGKTDDAQLPAQLVARLQDRFLPQVDWFKEHTPNGCCLYGEGYGARIQKVGGNYRPDQDFVLFDVKIGDWWLKRENVDDIAHGLGIDVVPIAGTGTLLDMTEFVRNGFCSQWGNFVAEGIVARPQIELRNRAGQRIITKLKHRDFRP